MKTIAEYRVLAQRRLLTTPEEYYSRASLVYSGVIAAVCFLGVVLCIVALVLGL